MLRNLQPVCGVKQPGSKLGGRSQLFLAEVPWPGPSRVGAGMRSSKRGLTPEILTAAQVKMSLQEGSGALCCPIWLGLEVAGAEFSEELCVHAVRLAIVWNAFPETRPQVRGLWDVRGGALPPALSVTLLGSVARSEC